MKNPKPVLIIVFAALLLIMMMILRIKLGGIQTPVTSNESFSGALWNTWGLSILIMSFILLAGGTSILVLLGGGWRWE
jgi:hypothetical protein